jgi:hypothetical protein
MSLLEKRVERTTSGRKRERISLKNEEIHGFLFLFEYYWSTEIMQDEEVVWYETGMREVHTSCGGIYRKRLSVGLNCE